VPEYFMVGAQHLSELAVPVFMNEKVVAVINLEHDEPNRYTTRDQMLVEILAHHISLAMAELQRREAEGSFRTIFNKSPIAMNIARLSDGLQIDVNESALNLFGLKREEVIGKTMNELKLFKDPNTRSEFVKLFRKYGHLDNFEVDLVSKKRGTIKAVAVSNSIKINGVEYIINSILDVTSLEKAGIKNRGKNPV
jgi:PAS domain S-box-containing protein